MTIRTALETDLQAIVDIYNQAVSMGNATADTEPTNIEPRRSWLAAHSIDQHPVYVEEDNGTVRGWCSLTPYRAGRKALRHTAEISYYVDNQCQRQGIASRLVKHAMQDCSRLNLKTLFAIILDTNQGSISLLKKFGFEEWGYMPGVADFDGTECGHTYLGKRVESI
ncbi:MAG: GNAT family N-acetyltransferase [Opitutales bacterium]|nr:GNAT family N-acetyltransferase [Opitutales bacterium]